MQFTLKPCGHPLTDAAASCFMKNAKILVIFKLVVFQLKYLNIQRRNRMGTCSQELVASMIFQNEIVR